MNRVFAVFLLLFAFGAQAEAIKAQPITLGSASHITITSDILKQKRDVLVHLPEGYSQSEQAYPVLYLLDGERHLNHAILAYRLYREQALMPDVIIVAIPNRVEEEARTEDLYRNRQGFAGFLEKELIPAVDKRFRTNGDNGIYGHSLGGFFILDLFATNPDVFNRYIAASPPLQRNHERIYQAIKAHQFESDKRLYFTMGAEQEEGPAVFQAYQRFVSDLTQQKPEKLTWKSEVLQDQTHITNYYITLFKGLRAVY